VSTVAFVAAASVLSLRFSCSQFHQHFTTSFTADFLAPKLFNPKLPLQ
jgi:hypothetical protein